MFPLVALLAACKAPRPTGEGTLAVAATWPADGAAAVPEDTVPEVLLNKPIPQGVGFSVVLERGDHRTLLSCAPDAEAITLICPPERALAAEAHYRLLVDLGADGEVEAEADFSTALPTGLGYDVGPGLTLERAGGSEAAIPLLQAALEDQGTLLLVLQGFDPPTDAPPYEGTWLLGRGQVLPGPSGQGEAAVREDEGYPLAASGTLKEDGRFFATAEAAFLPVSIDGVHVPLLLQQVEIAGEVAVDADYASVSDVEIGAIVPERALEALLDAAPGWASLLEELLVLDVDTDRDGRSDAAAIEVRTLGERVVLVDEPRAG